MEADRIPVECTDNLPVGTTFIGRVDGVKIFVNGKLSEFARFDNEADATHFLAGIEAVTPDSVHAGEYYMDVVS